MKKIDWALIGYVKRSKRRLEALKLLEKPQMPSELAKVMQISLTHASKLVRELNANKLIYCLNNKMRVGRIYTLSNSGKQIKAYISKL